MDIREAEDDDLPPLLALYRHLDPNDAETTLDDARVRLALLRRYPGSGILVGCVDGALVTSCTLVIVPNLTRGGMPYALIENVVTHADHRGKGYGTALLKAAAAAAWRADCYKVMLLTGSKRPAVHQFYLGAGFEQTKTGFQIRRLPTRSG